MELRERLRLALGTGSQAGLSGGVSSAAESGLSPASRASPVGGPWFDLPVRRTETAEGAVHLAEEWWPLDHHHGRIPLSGALDLDSAAMVRLAPGLDSGDLGGAAFVDVETTGLSGGTGTYVFLVGVGTLEDASFRLRQYFLADLRDERAMLAAVTEALSGCRALVSFNGRRFDVPLLETRLTLNRLRCPELDLPHLDLLYPARRLYGGRLLSCRLAYLEEALLGVEREEDVPGWAIPSIYFDYLRGGGVGALPAVFRHNALDILSLVGLLAHLGRVAGVDRAASAGDCVALGRWDEREGRLDEAQHAYEAALAGGAEDEVRAVAVRRLACLYRRRKWWDGMLRLWRAQIENAGEADRRLEALVELAKLEEHRRRDYVAAEALSRRALSLVEVMALSASGRARLSVQREALEHRLGRLRRRRGLGPSRGRVGGERGP